MALTGIGSDAKGRSVVFFQAPRERPSSVAWLLRLLIVSAVYAVVSVFTIFLDMEPILTTVLDIEQVFLADPVQGEEELRDVARLAAWLAALTIFGLLFLVVYIPVRYGLLAARVNHGSPETYRAIRFVVRLQVGMEVARLLFLFTISTDLESIRIDILPTFTLVLAPAILLLLRKQDVKRYFSWYETQADGGAVGFHSPHPTAAPVAAAADPAHAGWEPHEPTGDRETVR